MFKTRNQIKFPEMEHDILEFWKENSSFEKSLAQRKGSEEFVIYDGPPFATGLPHYGHLLAGTIKDVVPRYQTMRGKYCDRTFGWDCHGLPVEYEMEKQLSFYIPQSFPEALRCLAAEVEQKELMQKQRDEAIRTKAYISDKKTATAMNTASQKSREVEKLKRELDKSKEFASIKAAEIRLKSKFDWKPLRNYCTSHELEMPKIFDANYGSVRTYPAEAWQEIYGVDLKELF